MLKKVIEREMREQNIDRAVLFDGICTEEEFLLWEQDEEPSLWLMQIHAISQRLGKSVDKYDVVVDEEEFLLALRRSKIVLLVRRGKLKEAEKAIKEYGNFLQKIEKIIREENEAGYGKRKENTVCDNGESAKLLEGEWALHRQFLALERAEIARRRAASYPEQLEIILCGLQQTIPKTAWEKRGKHALPSHKWFATRRLHLMEQFLLSRFIRVYECMGQEKERKEEAFLWYQELASYLLTTSRDRADVTKLHPLLCYRMAENRLHRIFGKNTWWEEEPEKRAKGKFTAKKEIITFTEHGVEEVEEFGYAEEYMRTLKNLTEGLAELSLAQKQFPLFRKMERMRLVLLQRIPLFGRHTVEENTWRVLERAWEELCRAVKKKKDNENIMAYAALTKEKDSKRMSVMEDSRIKEGVGGNKEIVEYQGMVYTENAGCIADTEYMIQEIIVSTEHMEEKTIGNTENFDVDYMERSVHNFCELLSRRMQLHDWNIFELGDEIYADPKKSLLPILKGKAKPKPKKRRALQERLGISLKKFDPGFLTFEDTEYKKYAHMMRAYNEGKFKEGQKLLEELEEKMDWNYMTNEQLGIYWDALFSWKEEKITEEEKNLEMWKILEYSGVKREKFAKVGADLTKTEWKALVEIAWNREGEDLLFLQQVFKKQEEYMEETGRASFYPEYYIKILYCLSSIAREIGDLDEAEYYADKGLCAVYGMDLYIQWSAFLFAKFRIVEDRKNREMEEEDFEYIRQAYAVEKLFGKSSFDCKGIEKYLKKHYKQDILADMN